MDCVNKGGPEGVGNGPFLFLVMKIWLEPFSVIDRADIALVALLSRMNHALTCANYTYSSLAQLMHDAVLITTPPNKDMGIHAYEVQRTAEASLTFKQKYVDFMREFESDLGASAEWCILFEDFGLNWPEHGQILDNLRKYHLAFTAYLAIDDLMVPNISGLERQFQNKWRWIGESWVNWITDTQLKNMGIKKGIPQSYHAYSVANPGFPGTPASTQSVHSGVTFPQMHGQPVFFEEEEEDMEPPKPPKPPKQPKQPRWRSIDDE